MANASPDRRGRIDDVTAREQHVRAQVAVLIAAGLLVPVLEDFAAPPNGIYAILPHATRHLPLRVRLV